MAGEWPTATVDNLAAKERNALVGGPFGSNLVSRDYVISGVPVVRGQNLGDRWVSGDFVFVTAAKATALSANLARPGDIVFTQRGTLGQVGIVPAEPFARYLISQSQMKLTVDREIADPVFYYYVFSAPEQQEYVRQNAIQTGVPHINLGILRNTPVPLPPLSEQRAIAHILGTLDDKIELNRRMNDTLEAIARALFKSWFVDFDPVRANMNGHIADLPNEFAGMIPRSFSPSELGNVPAGWRPSTLGGEANRCGGIIQTGPFGSQLHASDYLESGVPVIMPQDLSRRRVSTAKIAKVSESNAQRLARHRVRPGDIIYSRRGDVERHALIGAREAGWLCGTGCLLVRMGENFPSPLFASLALDLPETRAWIVQHAIGATMPNLNTGILARVPMLMPDDALLHRFELTLRPLAKRIVDNDQNAEVLGDIRDTLLPKLISGELRVKAAEKIVEAVA